MARSRGKHASNADVSGVGAAARIWLAAGGGSAAVVGVGVLAAISSAPTASAQPAPAWSWWDGSSRSNLLLPEELWLVHGAGSRQHDRSATSVPAVRVGGAVRPMSAPAVG